MNTLKRILIILNCLLFISIFFVSTVKAKPLTLIVQEVEINPDCTIIGEKVSIKMNFRNNERDSVFCCATFLIGGQIFETKEITINSQSSEPVFFVFNTSELTQGNHSVETVVESSGQEKIFDLGNLELTTELPSDPVSQNVSGFYWQFLLVFIPIGAVVSFLVLKSKRGKKLSVDEEGCEIEKLPELLNNILMGGGKEEPVEPDNLKSDNSYIR